MKKATKKLSTTELFWKVYGKGDLPKTSHEWTQGVAPGVLLGFLEGKVNYDDVLSFACLCDCKALDDNMRAAINSIIEETGGTKLCRYLKDNDTFYYGFFF